MTPPPNDPGIIEPWCVGMLNRELARSAARGFMESVEGLTGPNSAHEVMHLNLEYSLEGAGSPAYLRSALRCEFLLQNLFHSLLEDFFPNSTKERFVHKELRSLLSTEIVRYHLFRETGFLQGNVAFWTSPRNLPEYPTLSRYWEEIAPPWWPFSTEAFKHVQSEEEWLRKDNPGSDLTIAFMNQIVSRATSFSVIAAKDYASFLSGRCRLTTEGRKGASGEASKYCLCSEAGESSHPFAGSKSILMAFARSIRSSCSGELPSIELSQAVQDAVKAQYEASVRDSIRNYLEQIVKPSFTATDLGDFDTHVIRFLFARTKEECLRICVDSLLRGGRSFMPLRHIATTVSDRQHGWLFVAPEEIRNGVEVLSGMPDATQLEQFERCGVVRFVPKIFASFACHDFLGHRGAKTLDLPEKRFDRALFVIPLAAEVLQGSSSHFAQFVTTVTAWEDGDSSVHSAMVTDEVCQYRADRGEKADLEFTRLRTQLLAVDKTPQYRDAFLMSDSEGKRLHCRKEEDLFKKLVRLRSLLFTMGQVICGRDVAQRARELAGADATLRERETLQRGWAHAMKNSFLPIRYTARTVSQKGQGVRALLRALTTIGAKRLAEMIEGVGIDWARTPTWFDGPVYDDLKAAMQAGTLPPSATCDRLAYLLLAAMSADNLTPSNKLMDWTLSEDVIEPAKRLSEGAGYAAYEALDAQLPQLHHFMQGIIEQQNALLRVGDKGRPVSLRPRHDGSSWSLDVALHQGVLQAALAYRAMLTEPKLDTSYGRALASIVTGDPEGFLSSEQRFRALEGFETGFAGILSAWLPDTPLTTADLRVHDGGSAFPVRLEICAEGEAVGRALAVMVESDAARVLAVIVTETLLNVFKHGRRRLSSVRLSARLTVAVRPGEEMTPPLAGEWFLISCENDTDEEESRPLTALDGKRLDMELAETLRDQGVFARCEGIDGQARFWFKITEDTGLYTACVRDGSVRVVFMVPLSQLTTEGSK